MENSIKDKKEHKLNKKINIEESKKNGEEKGSVVKDTVNCFIACSIFIICDIFFKISTFYKYEAPLYSYIFTVFLGIVIYGLIFAITKKTFRATVTCYSAIFIINIINFLKIYFTDEPLYFSDINFLSKSNDLLRLITENISVRKIIIFILIMVSYISVLALISIISFNYNYEIKNKKTRIGIIIVCITILLLLFLPNIYTKEIYLKLFFNTDKYTDFNSYTDNLSFYQKNGLINGMYGIILNNKFIEPQNYDEEALNKMLVKTAKEYNKKLQKPNIIVVFSESFWDIDQLSEIEFDKKITPNFNKLKEKGRFVNLITPSYGGMSENVAFEFLTCGNMNFFPKGYIPIMSLYSRKKSENIPSLVKVLNKNGYRSEIVFGKDYYNSEKAYLKLGFNDYTEIMPEGYDIVLDEYCIDLLIDRLEKKEENKPLFYMLETIESHMPFYKAKYEKYDVSITKSNLNESMNDALRTYAQGMYNADVQLGRLYEFIEEYNEPTILIFFGDHLPYIYTNEKENVINKIKKTPNKV